MQDPTKNKSVELVELYTKMKAIDNLATFVLFTILVFLIAIAGYVFIGEFALLMFVLSFSMINMVMLSKILKIAQEDN